MAFTIEKNDVSYSKESVGLVIDVSFLKNLQLKSGKDQKLFEKAINDWAEKQVDQDIEQKQLKAFIESKKGTVDDYFDNEILGDYYNDRDDLKELLVEYIDTVNEHQHELRDLTSAIDFKLTDQGNNKIMNGIAVTTYYQTSGMTYLGMTKNMPNIQQSNSKINKSTSGPNDDFALDESWGGRLGPGENNFNIPTTVEKAISTVERVPNQKTSWKYENIYERESIASDVEGNKKSQFRKILRKWIKGKDDYIDIASFSGRDKVDKPTQGEVSLLHAQFKQPLQRLTSNTRLLGKKLSKDVRDANDEITIRDSLVTTYNREGFPKSGSHDTYVKAWEGEALKLGIDKKRDIKLFSQEMATLSVLYSQYRSNAGHMRGSYTGKILAMMDHAVLRDGSGGLADINNNNNDETGNVVLSHGEIIIKDKNRHQRRALNLLETEVSNASTTDMESIIKNGSPRPQIIKKLLDDTQISTDNSNLYRFKGGKELYNFIRDQKVNNSNDADLSVILAEGYAYGVDPVDMYNIKMLADYASLSLTVSDSQRFVYFLSDFNNNGRTGPEDHAVNGGAQLIGNYRLAVAQMRNIVRADGSGIEDPEQAVAYNILSYMKNTAGHKLDHYVKETLGYYLKNPTIPLVDIASKHPGLIVYMQDVLKNLPLNVDLQSIMVSGDVHAERDHMKPGSFLDKMTPHQKEQYNQIVNNHIESFQASVSLDPELREYYGYMTRESLAQHIAQTVSNAMYHPKLNINSDVAGGVGVALEIAKGLQIHASLAMGEDKILVPGVGIGYNKSLRKGGYAALNANFLVPAISGRIGNSREGKMKNVSKTLEAKKAKTHAITLHGGVSTLNVISVGVGYQQDIDRMKGIEQVYAAMLKTTQTILPKIFDEKLKADYISLKKSVKQANYLQNEPALTQIKNRIVSSLAKGLGSAYKDSTSSQRLDAANNIFEAMINTDFDGSKASYENISSYFAEQRKEQSVNDIKGKLKITGRGVGIHAFISPVGLFGILPVTMRISRLKGYRHRDTNESLYNQQRAEWSGRDNRFVPFTTKQKISYMNEALGADSFDGLASSLYIESSADGRFLEIPYELFETDRLNIKISPSMKGRLAKENGKIVVPVDVPLRFSALPQVNGIEYVLNIGSTLTSSQDIHLLKGRESLLFQDGRFKESRDDLDVSVAQTYETGVNIKILYDQLKSYGISVDFIENNILTYNTNKTVNLDGGMLQLSDGGTITFSIGDRGIVSYIVTTIDKKEVTETIPGNKKIVKGDPSPQALRYKYELDMGTITSIDDQVNTKLEAFERTGAMKAFMAGAVDAHKDGGAGALSALKKLNISAITTIIDNGTPQQKRELVAYMTQVFAIEDAGYRGQTGLILMKKRDVGTNRPAFMRVPGSEGLEALFGTATDGSARKMFEKVQGVSEKPNYTQSPQSNLIGYTAFYRKGFDDKKNERGYAMTLPGYTRVLGGKTTSFENDTQRAAAKRWLMAKIETDPFAQELILKALQNNLSDYPDIASQINVDTAIKLLRGQSVPLDGCTVELKANPVYYLLAECANESIGLEIESITCVVRTESEDETTLTRVIDSERQERVTIEGNCIKEYNDGLFAINTTGTRGSTTLGGDGLKQGGFGFGAAVGAKINSYGGTPPPVDDSTDPEIDPPPPVDDDWTGNGGGMN